MKKNIRAKTLLTLSISLIIVACGRTIVDDPTATLSPPSITALTNTDNGRVKIDWYYSTYQEPLIKGFLIERAENNGQFKAIASNLTANQRSLELAETLKNGQVSFRVSSIGEKDTTASAIVSYFTPNVASTTLCTSLYATLLETNNKPSVYLYWKLEKNSSTYAGNYIVQRAIRQEDFQTIATIQQLNYLDDHVSLKETYRYRILLASNICPSNEIPLNIAPNVAGLCAKALTLRSVDETNKKSIILTWNAQLSDFSNFSIKRAFNINGPFETISSSNIRSTVFEDVSELKPNTSYFYKISTQINAQPPSSCESDVVEIKK